MHIVAHRIRQAITRKIAINCAKLLIARGHAILSMRHPFSQQFRVVSCRQVYNRYRVT